MGPRMVKLLTLFANLKLETPGIKVTAEKTYKPFGGSITSIFPTIKQLVEQEIALGKKSPLDPEDPDIIKGTDYDTKAGAFLKVKETVDHGVCGQFGDADDASNQNFLRYSQITKYLEEIFNEAKDLAFVLNYQLDNPNLPGPGSESQTEAEAVPANSIESQNMTMPKIANSVDDSQGKSQGISMATYVSHITAKRIVAALKGRGVEDEKYVSPHDDPQLHGLAY